MARRPWARWGAACLAVAVPAFTANACVVPYFVGEDEGLGGDSSAGSGGKRTSSGGESLGGQDAGSGGTGATTGTGGESGTEDCGCSDEQSCQDGECFDWECTPSEDFCSGNEVLTCASNGLSSEPKDTCGDDQYCDPGSGSCKDGVCAPFQPTCVSNSVRICNDEGTGFESGATPCGSGESCSGGECKPHVCMPGAGFCQGLQRKQCSDNGLSSTVEETCADVCLDSEDTALCVECEPDPTPQCVSNAVKTCSEEGSWETVTVCAGTHCSSASCAATPKSCQNLTANCGPTADESCCTSHLVEGGAFNRVNDASLPATVSDFRLDKYEVTVGRFRKFVSAVVGGWRPSSGSGKHSHLNGGSGLSNSHSASTYEPGWKTAWNDVGLEGIYYGLYVTKAEWDSRLACNSTYSTWTASAGDNENRPINCVSWLQAYAFCIWDGGLLPSDVELNYAHAGGSEQRQYPWPSSTDLDCASASYDYCVAGEGSLENLIPVGTKPQGNGRWGQSDLVGNVQEWALDDGTAGQGGLSKPGNSSSCNNCGYFPSAGSDSLGSYRFLWGGAFDGGAGTSSSRESAGGPFYGTLDRGVRCARAP